MIFKLDISAMIKKFNYFCLLITLGLMCTITSSYADTRILILGDSLSASYSMQQNEGWVALLQNTFNSRKEQITLINASISGETTAGGLARLDKLLNKQNPDVVLIELGGNDGLRGFPVKKAKQNLLQMIEKVRAKAMLPLLMQIRIPPNYGPRYTKMFADIYTDIAKTQQVTLLPFFMENIATDPNLMLPDGIHPNKKAMPKISELMDKALLKALAEIKN